MASVVNIYARAFADVVIDKRLDPTKTLDEVEQIAALFRESKALREVWEAPSIPAEQKRAVLDAIVKRAGISKMVRNVVAVVIDKRRTEVVDERVTPFAQGLDKRMGLEEE